MDEINSPFKPSIKLLPLIKINKQNVEKKIAKNLLFKITSNNSIHFHDKEDNSRAVGIFKKHNVSFKTGATASTPLKVPGDSRDTWIRIGVGSGILDAPYIQELLVR